MTLEDHITEAALRGGLDGLTLWPAAAGWQANVRRQGSTGWTVAIHQDAATAVLQALSQGVPQTPTEPKPTDNANLGVFG